MESETNERAAVLAKGRAAQRKLLEELDEKHAEYTSTTSTGLMDAQGSANHLFEALKGDARGADLDSQAVKKISVLGLEQASNLDKAGEVYVRSLKNRFGIGGGKLNWTRLSQAVAGAGVYMHVPGVTFVLGEVETAAPKQRKERKKKERTQTEPLQTAKTVSVKQLQETAEEKAQVARMKVMLEKVQEVCGEDGKLGRINLFHLVLHPTSFSQTVENWFDLAFLVKDGRVAIESDAETDCLYVRTAKPPATDEFEGGLIKKQNVISLDHTTYSKLVDRWCISSTPLLPCRAGKAASNKQKQPRGDADEACDEEDKDITQPLRSKQRTR